jgi:hypothetical protein
VPNHQGRPGHICIRNAALDLAQIKIDIADRAMFPSFLVEWPLEQVKLDTGHPGVGAVLVDAGGSYDLSTEGPHRVLVFGVERAQLRHYGTLAEHVVA